MHEICQSEFCPIAWTITRMAGENEKHCATMDEMYSLRQVFFGEI